jgi:hypothetical protein
VPLIAARACRGGRGARRRRICGYQRDTRCGAFGGGATHAARGGCPRTPTLQLSTEAWRAARATWRGRRGALRAALARRLREGGGDLT